MFDTGHLPESPTPGETPLAVDWSPLGVRRWILVLLLLAAGLGVRWYGLGQFPRPHQTDDEYHFLWAGLSLLSEGRPTSWSRLHEREPINYEALGARMTPLTYEQHQYFLVRPALDHPPLFSLVAGAWARLVGAAVPHSPVPGPGGLTYWNVNLARARTLTLVLYAATFFCLLALARHAFSFEAAFVGLLLYSFTMHIVAHGRLLVSENLTTPLFLASLVAVQRYTNGRMSRGVFAAVTITAVAAALLCKLVAVSQVGAIVFLLCLARRPRAAVYPILGALLGLGLYLAYGGWQGWSIFRAILHVQADRFKGFDILSRFILTPALVHDAHFSYLVLSGWLALFATTLNRRRSALMLAPLVYLLGFAYFASMPAIYGWHILPIYPFLSLALGVVVCDVWRKCDTVAYSGLVVMLLPYTANALFYSRTDYAAFWRMFYLAAAAACLLLPLAGGALRRRTIHAVIVLLLTIALAFDYRLLQIWTEGGP
ncbi:MAG: hypothetical protein M1457_09440 [bacterium]|nr:hypothetical protein [bacterium]